MNAFLKKRLAYSVAAFFAVMLITSFFCHTCMASVYWANFDGNTIAQADPDSFNRNQSWISGFSDPLEVTVDSNYIYWTNYDDDTIGRANLESDTISRANLDGTGFTQDWITGFAVAPLGSRLNGTYIVPDRYQL